MFTPSATPPPLQLQLPPPPLQLRLRLRLRLQQSDNFDDGCDRLNNGSVFAVVARREGGQDDYVMQCFQNYVDRLGLVKAELACDQGPTTLDVSNASIKRCQSTALIVTATPKGSKGCLERRERATLIIQGHLRAFREAVSMNHKTEVGLDHVLMGWMVRQCALVVTNFQVKGTRRTPYRSMRCKYYTGEVVPFLCHLDGAKPF